MRGFLPHTILVLFVLLTVAPLAAQEKQISHQSQYWLSYTLGTKINDHWSARISTEDRRFFINNRNHMFYVLTDATYKVNKKWSLTAGMMYFSLDLPSNPHVEMKVRSLEFRPYQRVAYGWKLFPKTNMTASVTLEERFRMTIVAGEQTNDYKLTPRFRNKIAVKHQLSNAEATKPVSLYAYNDFMFQVGSVVGADIFDQNRFSVGLEYKILPHITIKGGYLHWYQEIAQSSTVFERHIVTFGISQIL